MTKKNAEQTVAPTPHFDASGNPGLVAPGELIESAWGNAVVTRVQLYFPDIPAMNAVSPAQGTIAVTTDHNFIWIRDAGFWKLTALGNRPAFRVLGGAPGQSIAPSVPAGTLCTFATEDDPWNLIAAGVFTVPAGFGGRWVFEWSTEIDGGVAGYFQSWLQIGTTKLGLQTVGGTTGVVHQSASASAVLASTMQVGVFMKHTAAVAMPVNTTADQYFHGYYAGPY